MDEIRRELRKSGDELLRLIGEVIDSYVILGDADGLNDLALLLHMHLDHRLLCGLRRKGFGGELEALATEAGKVINKRGEKQ